MKRMLTLFLALGLLLSASFAHAETVREQVNAPERVQASYQSNTGKTTVAVDAQVIVPDVSALPMAKVDIRRFAAEDAWRLAHAARPVGDWFRREDINSFVPYADEKELLESPNSAPGHHFWNYYLCDCPLRDGRADYSPLAQNEPYYNVWLSNWDYDTPMGMQSVMRTLGFKRDVGYNRPDYSAKTQLWSIAPIQGERIPGQTLTLSQARALAEELVATVTEDFALYAEGAQEGNVCYHKEDTDVYDNKTAAQKAYAFLFARQYAGVPVTPENRQMSSTLETQDYAAPAPGYESIAVTVHESEVVAFQWEYACAVGETLAADSALLPFDEIMNIFGEIAPLTIQSNENDNEILGGTANRWDITDIRLGYMPVRLKDDPGTWVLKPVWDFFGIRSFAHEYYDNLGQSALTIDAVDGTVIDRNYGY